MIEKKLVPPDGGFGWIIVGAVALHNVIAHSVSTVFGLAFKEVFKELEFSALDISLIMNTNSAFALGLGLIHGVLIKYLGYRKVAFFGAIFLTAGILLTLGANSFVQYFISYSVITALGTGMGISSFGFALNSYFSKNRAKAVSYAFTISGLGPAFMPLLFSFLMNNYGVKGALMLFGAIAANTFVSSLLLQPIEWHMKEELIEEENEDENLLNQEKKDVSDSKNTKTIAEESFYQSTYDLDMSLGASIMSLYSEGKGKRRSSHISMASTKTDKNLNDDRFEDSHEKLKKSKDITLKEEFSESQDGNLDKNREELSIGRRIINNLVSIFDLELLKDLTFLNLMFGMSLAAFAEINFSLLTPFIMQDLGLNTQEISTFLSTQAITDICFRFIAPYVSNLCNKSVRVMYLWSLVLLILSRSSLLLTNDYFALLGCSAFIGLARGFRTIYWTLVMPSYVPIERLPAASGLQSTVNSVFIWIGGPFLGFIRDITGSPTNCIIIINMVSATCIVMWCTEFIYKRYKSRRKEASVRSVC